MPLTTQQILDTINTTASKLGFSFVATENNIDDVIVTQPEQVNRFIDALNPIIHDKIMTNMGNRGIMKRFIDKQKGGSTSRHISFGYKTDNPSSPTPNTLEGLVSTYNINNATSVFSINHSFSKPVTVDRRELAKTFTPRSLITYIDTISNHLEKTFYVFILNNLINTLYSNLPKTLVLVQQNMEIDPLITLHQAIYSGTLSTDNIEQNIVGFIIPENVDKTLSPYECALLVDLNELEWFKKYHFHPDGIERYVVHIPPNIEKVAYFLLPFEAIVIEEYNRYVEVQEIPNMPGRYNIFFNSDVSIDIDFRYPIGSIRSNIAGEPT